MSYEQTRRAVKDVLAASGVALTRGKVFFVDSTSLKKGNAVQKGDNPDDPLSTIDYAIGLCVASRGDVIVAMPGHTETITGAAGIAADVAGVTILGVGTGRLRPTINFTTATTAQMVISAANVRIKNLYFNLTGFDAIVAGISITGADCTIEDCEIEHASASAQATLGILTTAAANRLKIRNNHIHGTTDGGTAAAIRIVGGSDHIIENNFICGAYTTTLGGIDNATTFCPNLRITGNTIVNQTASSTVAINAQGATTGAIDGNNLGILSFTAPIVAGGISFTGRNYYRNASGVGASVLI